MWQQRAVDNALSTNTYEKQQAHEFNENLRIEKTGAEENSLDAPVQEHAS
jgi:hypothetical protein